MTKIIAAILAALMNIFSPEPVLQEGVVLSAEPSIVQVEYSQDISHTKIKDITESVIKKDYQLVPTLPPTPLPSATPRPSLTTIPKEFNIDTHEHIVKEKEEKKLEVPCLGCKLYISPLPTRIITPSTTPRPTDIIKPTPTYYPTPFPTWIITPIYEWPKPTPCPSVPPHLTKLPDGTQINPIYTEPIYCLDSQI